MSQGGIISIQATIGDPVNPTHGGTGVSNPTAHTLPVAEGSSPFNFLGPLTNGQLLIGNTGNDPSVATLSNGNNITWTGGAGTLTGNLTGTTNHAVQVGNAGGSLTSIGVGGANSVLVGNAGADPAFSTTGQIKVTSIGIGATPGASGLTFDGTNLLANYATGTFVPTVAGAVSGGAVTYTIQAGRYTRIGDRVMAQLNVAWSAHSGTGQLLVKSLPFTSNNASNSNCAFSQLLGASQTTAFTSPFAQGLVDVNATQGRFSSCSTAGALTATSVTATGDYNLQFVYGV